ncbi:hypothetical protein [Burkholderia phage FLC9]|nr:hypothetical protein [Burkholderia phage FLC9]
MEVRKTGFDPKSPTFHIELRAARVARKLSRQKLADHLKVTDKTIYNWEYPPEHRLCSRPRDDLLDRLNLFFMAETPDTKPDIREVVNDAKRDLAEALGVPATSIEIIIKL